MRRKPARPVLTVDPTRPQMTDHALIRLLKRSGLDVEAVRVAIEEALATAHGAAEALGGGDHVITVDGLSFVVRGGKITTVLPTHGPADRARALDHLPQK